MTSTFAQPDNDFVTTLASGHTNADGQLVLSDSPGTLAAHRIWRVTALLNPDTDTDTESVLGIFEATGNTGATLTVVTAAEGFSDRNLASGTAIQIRMTSKDLSEVQAAVNAAEVNVATLQTNQTADEATLASHTTELASHTTELASHASSLTTDASAITSLQSSRTTDEATLASHTTELASHAASLATDGSAITTLQTNQTADEVTIASHTTELATLTTGLAGAVMLPYATDAQAAFPGFYISAWGDSLTFSETPVSYETYLEADAYRSVFNGGIGGQTSTQIAARMLAATGQYSNSVIIWAGRNDAPNSIAPATTLANIASMVAALGHTRYIVLSIPNTSAEPSGNSLYTAILSLNASLASTYGAHYWDVRSYLVSQYNPSLPQDVIDHTNDVLPTSLRVTSDVLHPNNAGNALIAGYIAANLMGILNGDVLHPLDVAGLGPVLQLAALLAPLASPTFTGTVTAPIFTTAGAGAVVLITRRDNGAQAWAFYSSAGNLGVYNTALGGADAIDISLTDNSVTFAGAVTAPSFAGDGSNLTGLTEAHVTGLAAALALLAPIASPTFTGTVTAPGFMTAGAGAVVLITRRDNGAQAWAFYSSAGNLGVYNTALGADAIDISLTDNSVTFAASVTAPSFHGDGSGLTGLALASGQSLLGSGFSLTIDNTFQDTGLTVSIPHAGTYLMGYNVRMAMQVSGGSSNCMEVQLFDAVAAAAVPDSNRLMWIDGTGSNTGWQMHTAYTVLATFAGATTVHLYAGRFPLGGTATWTTAVLPSNADGYTMLSFVQIS